MRLGARAAVWLLLLLLAGRMSRAAEVLLARLSASSTTPAVLAAVRALVPPLSFAAHKGQAGRVGVVGGSQDYTGAPYYAATSALKLGADLSYVFCEKSAAPAIKSYSPELMVSSFYSSESPSQECNAAPISSALPRLHSLVIGPGLGRSKQVFEALAGVIGQVRAASLPLIIDADGLFMLSSEPSALALVHGYRKCILTPNKAEFDRLALAVLGPGSGAGAGAGADGDEARVYALSAALGHVTILLKGGVDIVSNGEAGVVVRVTERGSPRRCGGQGDLLAGALGVAAHWANLREGGAALLGELAPEEGAAPVPVPALVWACVLASITTKRAAAGAFEVHGRSTTTPDILNALGTAASWFESSSK